MCRVMYWGGAIVIRRRLVFPLISVNDKIKNNYVPGTSKHVLLCWVSICMTIPIYTKKHFDAISIFVTSKLLVHHLRIITGIAVTGDRQLPVTEVGG